MKPGEHPPFRGESLRKGHEPTVAALMARRVESMLKTPEGQQFELLEPCRMAAMLADLGPEGRHADAPRADPDLPRALRPPR